MLEAGEDGADEVERERRRQSALDAELAELVARRKAKGKEGTRRKRKRDAAAVEGKAPEAEGLAPAVTAAQDESEAVEDRTVDRHERASSKATESPLALSVGPAGSSTAPLPSPRRPRVLPWPTTYPSNNQTPPVSPSQAVLPPSVPRASSHHHVLPMSPRSPSKAILPPTLKANAGLDRRSPPKPIGSSRAQLPRPSRSAASSPLSSVPSPLAPSPNAAGSSSYISSSRPQTPEEDVPPGSQSLLKSQSTLDSQQLYDSIDPQLLQDEASAAEHQVEVSLEDLHGGDSLDVSMDKLQAERARLIVRIPRPLPPASQTSSLLGQVAERPRASPKLFLSRNLALPAASRRLPSAIPPAQPAKPKPWLVTVSLVALRIKLSSLEALWDGDLPKRANLHVAMAVVSSAVDDTAAPTRIELVGAFDLNRRNKDATLRPARSSRDVVKIAAPVHPKALESSRFEIDVRRVQEEGGREVLSLRDTSLCAILPRSKKLSGLQQFVAAEGAIEVDISWSELRANAPDPDVRLTRLPDAVAKEVTVTLSDLRPRRKWLQAPSEQTDLAKEVRLRVQMAVGIRREADTGPNDRTWCAKSVHELVCVAEPVQKRFRLVPTADSAPLVVSAVLPSSSLADAWVDISVSAADVVQGPDGAEKRRVLFWLDDVDLLDSQKGEVRAGSWKVAGSRPGSPTSANKTAAVRVSWADPPRVRRAPAAAKVGKIKLVIDPVDCVHIGWADRLSTATEGVWRRTVDQLEAASLQQILVSIARLVEVAMEASQTDAVCEVSASRIAPPSLDEGDEGMLITARVLHRPCALAELTRKALPTAEERIAEERKVLDMVTGAGRKQISGMLRKGLKRRLVRVPKRGILVRTEVRDLRFFPSAGLTSGKDQGALHARRVRLRVGGRGRRALRLARRALRKGALVAIAPQDRD